MHKTSVQIISLVVVLVVGFFIADYFLFDGIAPREIHTEGIQGKYFSQASVEKSTTVMLLGGGAWSEYWALEFAQHGWVGLSLPYTGKKGLPQLPEELDLAYFETALTWLSKQPEVDANKLIVMGASRHAELALLIAATFPNLVDGVIAYAPSAVVWSNTVLAYNSDELKASYVYQGKEIPYLSMKKIQGNNVDTLRTLNYWNEGLSKTEEAERAAIKVEMINGPIVLFSGEEDQVWPATRMAKQIEKRIAEHQFSFPITHISYPKAGHLISAHPEVSASVRTGKLTIKGKEYPYYYGGTVAGDDYAKSDAKKRVIQFLQDL